MPAKQKEAAVRELSEETGLKTKDEDLAEFNGNYYVAEIERKDGGDKVWMESFSLQKLFWRN